jgi:hypothetical protein
VQHKIADEFRLTSILPFPRRVLNSFLVMIHHSLARPSAMDRVRRARGTVRHEVLIIGAAGMVGRKLTTRLLEEGHLGGRQKMILVLHDIVTTEAPQSAPFEVATLCSDVFHAR